MTEETTKSDTRRARGRGRPKGAVSSTSRDALLNAAIDAFGDRGFEGASLKQISDVAGADVALTRYYFGSKDGLWRAAIDHLAAQLTKDLQQTFTTEHSSNAEALKAAIRWFVDMSSRWPQISRIIVFEGNADEDRRNYVTGRLVQPFYVLMEMMIRGAKAEGAIGDISTRTLFFMITHGGSFPMALPELTNAFPGGDIGRPQNLKTHAEAIIAMVFGTD
ncbi:MAG: TetR/AcrR family transcriptional regulator [Erythrobacter sp.]